MTERTSHQIIDYEKIRSIRLKLEKDIVQKEEKTVFSSPSTLVSVIIGYFSDTVYGYMKCSAGH